MKKVLIPTKLDSVAVDILTEHGGYLAIQDSSKTPSELAAEHPDAFALIVRSEEITAGVMEKMPSLKVVVRAGAGFNTIDTKAARHLGIDVMNTPGANSNAVAEEVLALMLADARHIIAADASTRSGAWEKSRFMGREIAGKTVGIVGLGNVGRLVAKRLEGFECRLLGYDPIVSEDRTRQLGIKTTDLRTLFAESDFITLHIPENKDTRGLINENLLGLMKEGATLINCARAGVVDEQALREVKPLKKLRFLNDVYHADEAGEKSVADIADIMLPHLGASTYEANENAARRAAQQLIDLNEKGVTSYIVNRSVPEGLDEEFCHLSYVLATLARGMVGRKYPLVKIETSFYGSLEPYRQWLFLACLHGIWDDIDCSTDVQTAMGRLSDLGISYIDREVDPAKHYENSVTLDLQCVREGRRLQWVSVRGTVAEGVCMVSRINQFDRLYWVPRGVALFFQYEDRPGVIAIISKHLAEAGVNIEDMRNPHDHKTGESLAILSVSAPVSEELMQAIDREIQAKMAYVLNV